MFSKFAPAFWDVPKEKALTFFKLQYKTGLQLGPSFVDFSRLFCMQVGIFLCIGELLAINISWSGLFASC